MGRRKWGSLITPKNPLQEGLGEPQLTRLHAVTWHRTAPRQCGRCTSDHHPRETHPHANSMLRSRRHARCAHIWHRHAGRARRLHIATRHNPMSRTQPTAITQAAPTTAISATAVTAAASRCSLFLSSSSCLLLLMLLPLPPSPLWPQILPLLLPPPPFHNHQLPVWMNFPVSTLMSTWLLLCLPTALCHLVSFLILISMSHLLSLLTNSPSPLVVLSSAGHGLLHALFPPCSSALLALGIQSYPMHPRWSTSPVGRPGLELCCASRVFSNLSSTHQAQALVIPPPHPRAWDNYTLHLDNLGEAGELGKDREVAAVARVGVQGQEVVPGVHGAANRERAPLAIGEVEQEGAHVPIQAVGITWWTRFGIVAWMSSPSCESLHLFICLRSFCRFACIGFVCVCVFSSMFVCLCAYLNNQIVYSVPMLYL